MRYSQKRPLVRVSRLCTTITLQRQIEAIYNLEKTPDVILWPIMEPNNGRENNMEAVQWGQDTFCDTLIAPFNFTENLLRGNVLNHSQDDFIKKFLHGYGLICKPQTSTKWRTEKNPGITLIQRPSGTGKTSTIVALISNLLFENKTKNRIEMDWSGYQRRSS